MSDINEWLENNTESFLGDLTFSEEKSEFRDAAKALVEQAQSAGYTIEQIKDACDGDVETYLMDRQNSMTNAAMEDMIADDQ